MRKKSITLTLSIGCRWLFFLIPTIELDWNTLTGYTRITWLWFFIEFYHWHHAIDPVTKQPRNDDNELCNLQHMIEQKLES